MGESESQWWEGGPRNPPGRGVLAQRQRQSHQMLSQCDIQDIITSFPTEALLIAFCAVGTKRKGWFVGDQLTLRFWDGWVKGPELMPSCFRPETCV